MPPADALHRFSAPVRAWFDGAFEKPTRAQELGWSAIRRRRHTLLHAPTGSGKTLAAFLWCLDRLFTEPAAAERQKRCRVLYISPLKALAYDVERNLRAPLAGIRLAAERDGRQLREVRIGSRTGDTPSDARRALVKDPPDILVTTPESLYLILTSSAREMLLGVEHVIVDEIHSLAGTKRGAHLALSLERLEALLARGVSGAAGPQRIGLSATQRPLEAIAAFLGGAGPGREVEIVDAGSRKALDLEVIVPVEDMSRLGELEDAEAPPVGPAAGPEARTSIWPAIHPRLLELIRQHRSTLIFVNSRRLAERLSARINELAGEELVRAHHGSIAREQRLQIEEGLKAGRLPALVATSSLELGIDMGAVDLVIQVESPTSVARGLQRIGRAGHQVDAPSTGKIFPKYRGDLVECAVVARRMHDGQIEATQVPRNPLDVLAQQVVAMCSLDRWSVDDLHAVVRRADNFRELSRESLEGVLDMLSGRYPSDEFAQLKPRIVWDRAAGTLAARNDARVLAVTSGGTIPDRGLFGVFLAGETGERGRRVGELDEEMVYESRVGEVFLLGASTWRIEEIGPDRVIVSPAPGEPAKMPFWKGDMLGRPVELGRAIGAFLREMDGLETDAAVERLRTRHDLDDLAARNLLTYLADEREATGTLPTDRTIVIERFRDELGDWRVCVLTPFGGRVHAPWALAIEARLRQRLSVDVQTLWSDDGIAVRLPEADEAPLDSAVLVDPDEVEDLLVDQLGGSALFAARFRENAGRALLLPRRRPGSRTPLWMQRQRSADLLAVASRYGSFPIILETYRECLRDVFDLPALKAILAGIRSREIRVTSVETRSASPFAASLLFDYVGSFMYEGDAPLAERRAQALALDRELLADLLGAEELRELLDPGALADLELELQALAETRRARSVDAVHDLLRRLGDLRTDEVAARAAPAVEAGSALAELERSRRAVRVRLAGEERWIAIEDSGRYRDALGVSPPPGVPEAYLDAGEAPLETLLLRWARTHTPFLAADPAARWGLAQTAAATRLTELAARGALLHGEFRPGGVEREFIDPDVLRALRRRSLARLRREIEPVPAEALARFLPAWHGVGSQGRGIDRLMEVIAQLEGLPLPASILERDVLSARVSDYTPRLLDELGAAGEIVWIGHGALGRDDGRVALYRRDRVELLAAAGAAAAGDAETDLHDRIRRHLGDRGASFFRELAGSTPGVRDDDLLDALWDLVWAGEVTNDTFAALRALGLPRSSSRRAARPRPGRLLALGPPRAAGRWSLVAGLVGEARSPTERSHAAAMTLLDRYGVVTREAVVAEPAPGGFAAIYPVLKAMEEAGRVRRGYFVAGLGAAQFALPGAVDRLRAEREPADDGRTVHVLAAADPANPYGGALPWPRRDEDERAALQRVPGAYVVIVDGAAALYVERGGRGLVTLPVIEQEESREAALHALHRLIGPGRPLRELSVERVDRVPVGESAWATALRDTGFRPSYRSYVLRP